jgi:hypothetical protein
LFGPRDIIIVHHLLGLSFLWRYYKHRSFSAGLSLAPLVIKVSSNFNVIATACLTVFIGCHRSVKPAPPSETVSKEHAMRFPFIGSAVLLSLFLLFKFLPKDLINTVLTLYFFVLGILALSCVLFTFDSVVFRGFLNFGSCKINI